MNDPLSDERINLFISSFPAADTNSREIETLNVLLKIADLVRTHVVASGRYVDPREFEEMIDDYDEWKQMNITP